MKRRIFSTYILDSVLILFILLLVAFSTTNVPFNVTEISSTVIATTSKNNIHGDAFLNFSVNDKNTSSNLTRKLYQSIFKYNFMGHSQLLVYSKHSESGLDFRDFSISFDSMNYDESVKAADAVLYSTQKSTVRFETLKINLFQYRNRIAETSFESSEHGFVYIPDYIADYFIMNSNGKYNNYFDFINDNNPLSLSLNIGDGIVRNYKIANIFKSNGFNPLFTNGATLTDNDGSTGRIMEDYIGKFIVLFDYKLVDAQDFQICSAIAAKKYSVLEYSRVISSIPNSTIGGIFYKITDNSLQPIDASNNLFLNINSNWSPQIHEVILLVVAFVLLLLLLCFHKKHFKARKLALLKLTEPIFVISLCFVVQLMGRILQFNYSFLQFFSFFFMVTAFVLFVYTMIIFLFELMRTKNVFKNKRIEK